ncbi:2-oxoacid:acceptor oxidoreductase subunit alpha [Candidatus Curtissbacteria bacterium]|nr:2-oxoacid:acceptor oxidoreductase subunit alpha [Candidatus Curtissbacteria bacterium]
MPNIFGIKIVGPAGAGVLSAGEILLRSLVKTSYYCQGYPEYPSLIKGGHNTYLITLSENSYPINSDRVDLLIALTQNALNEEHNAIDDNTSVICDQTLKPDHEIKKLFQPGLLEIAKAAGNPLTLNTAALGFISQQLKINPVVIWDYIKKELEGKSEELLNQNKSGFDKAVELSQKYHTNLSLPGTKNTDHKVCLTGSQATGLGAIAAGINFYAGYPMTPSSPLLHFLADHQVEYNYLVRQAEDEIGAINMIIGASFAGAKSMTGTSGGGFALMNEGLSLAAMLETPIILYIGMRPAPATGLPTWSSQADLLYATHAGHGEFPRVIVAPSDPKECYHLTYQAFVLSQRFHIPVIILSDKYLAENYFSIEDLGKLEPVPLSVELPKEGQTDMYPRYQFNLTGIQGRTIPGIKGGEYIANSDEHGSTGLVDETAQNRNSANQRRLNKFREIKKDIPAPEVKGEGDTAIISWGSNKYIVRIIAEELKMAHIHLTYVWPLPNDIKMLLENYHRLITIENNITHQIARLITTETGLTIQLQLGDDSGRPLDPKSLIEQIKHES